MGWVYPTPHAEQNFNQKDPDLLPPEVLFRKKEAFSDGVSSTEKSWFQEIQERIESKGLVKDDDIDYYQKNKTGNDPQYYQHR